MSAGRLERAPLHRLVDEAERLVHTEVVDRSTTETLVEAIGDLAVWVLGGLLLLWLMRLLVTLVRVSPLPASLKASALRLAPVVELVVALAYVTSALYELLTTQLHGVVSYDPKKVPGRNDSPERGTVQPVGFGEDEVVLPTSAQGLRGYALLQEYFALPEKFMFVEAFDLDFSQAKDTVDLLFLFDTAPRRRL